MLLENVVFDIWIIFLSVLNVWARIFKRIWGPGIVSKEWISSAYVAWLAGTITLFLLGSQAPIE
jgi:hypothetical protein